MVDFKSWKEGFKPKLENYILTLRILFNSIPSAIGVIIVILYFAVVVIVQFDPSLLGLHGSINVMSANFVVPEPLPPSWLNNYTNFSLPFGTTWPGINLYHAILKAIHIDLLFSLEVVIGGAIIGILLGLVAGYYGGWTDEILMRVTDVFFSIPFLVFVIAIGYFLGRSLPMLTIILLIVWWPTYARVVRGQVLSIKEQTYIEAARASGTTNFKIMIKHIFPNTLAPIFVQFSFDLATIVLILASLAFIGFLPGNAYLPELGALSSVGAEYIVTGQWWTIFFPGMAILVFALSMNLVGDGLTDAFNPRLRR